MAVGTNKILEHIQQNNQTILSGLSEGAELYLLSKLPNFFVYVTTQSKLYKCAQQLEILGKKPAIFPYANLDNHYSLTISSDVVTTQLKTLFALSQNNCDCLILEAQGLNSLLPNLDYYKSQILSFNVGNTYNFDEIIKLLRSLQYSVTDKLEKNGQLAYRGDIIDVYPINTDSAYRLSFFDDELESIKEIDLETNASKNAVQSVLVAPNTLFLPNDIDRVKNSLQKIQKSINLGVNEKLKLNENISRVLDNLDQNPNAMPNIWAQSLALNSSIMDWLPQSSVVASMGKPQLFSLLEHTYSEILTKKRELFLSGECLPYDIEFDQIKNNIETKFNAFNQIYFENFVSANSTRSFELECLPIYNYKNKKESLFYDVRNLLDQNYLVVLFCPSELDETFLREMFDKHSITYENLSSLSEIGTNNLYFYKSPLPYGLIIKEDKIAYIPIGDKGTQRRETTYQKNSQPFFELPKAGDYVVHNFHGIGLCQGIQTIETSNFKRDYIVVQYAGTDKFYLPVENADQLSKYVGAENPKLNKIGGAEFERAKSRVRAQMELLATDMLEIYYEREHAKGHIYEVNTFIDKEFADSFPYPETPDQLKVMEEIKADLASPKIMDRLLCGDVGYGKTEIAFRTAMIAINNSKQVVMLVPTTILSEQHYRSALSRFSGFGVRIELLNRFKTPKEVADIQNRVANGEVDLLIGTQKVLNQSIKYKNLGLLILDEEQRLGVNDKEKIKKLKTNIDVLSMSATPIPRTLNMALTGVREISTITTPPKMRKSIETTVMEYSESVMMNAIKDEISRDGQVFVITDKIDGIENIAGKIKATFPELNVAFAHAQMNKIQLENITLKLFSGEIDVLVSTTLIENGIDLPNANTLIVLNADRFGLSQLYQLRGRVGRSDKQAYAYFCFASFKQLSSESAKRLQALQDFTDLGSGFKISMRDLEIRGAGTILGEKQSGHMEKIGYDMYCKLLVEALESARGKQVEKLVATKIDVDLNTEIPQWFISNETTRFDCISKISKIETPDELKNLENEFTEIYGRLPDSMLNLMQIALLKNLAQFFGISHIVVKNGIGLKATMQQINEYGEKLLDLLSNSIYFCVSKQDNLTIIKNKTNELKITDLIEIFKNILYKCKITILK